MRCTRGHRERWRSGFRTIQSSFDWLTALAAVGARQDHGGAAAEAEALTAGARNETTFKDRLV